MGEIIVSSSGPSDVGVDPGLAVCGDNVFHVHCDGDDSGTVFTDVAPGGGSLTRVGNVVTSTISKKFGTASAFMNEQSGAHVPVPLKGRLPPGSLEWCFEYWVNANAALHDQRVLISDSWGPTLWIDTSMRPIFFCGSGMGGGWTYTITGSAMSIGTWHHVVVEFYNGVITQYVDGAQSGTPLNASVPPTLADLINIGDPFTNGGVNGRLDELRGRRKAVYKGTFTPSTEAFADATSLTTAKLGEVRSDGAGGLFICNDATSSPQGWKRVA